MGSHSEHIGNWDLHITQLKKNKATLFNYLEQSSVPPERRNFGTLEVWNIYCIWRPRVSIVQPYSTQLDKKCQHRTMTPEQNVLGLVGFLVDIFLLNEVGQWIRVIIKQFMYYNGFWSVAFLICCKRTSQTKKNCHLFLFFKCGDFPFI